jgi:Uma2 family endonuclease
MQACAALKLPEPIIKPKVALKLTTTVAEPTTPIVVVMPAVLLAPVSWQTYQSLLTDLNDNSAVHLTYQQGCLEITMPLSPTHERYSSLIDKFIMVLSEELQLEIDFLGSTTLTREDLQHGLEPDNCYYIQHEALVREESRLDLMQLPPPDLVVEVDITSFSIDKLASYRALGVPEVWRYEGNNLLIYQLRGEEYVTSDNSPTFANLPLTTVIPQLLKQRAKMGQLAIIREFRKWVKEMVQK